LCLAVLHQDHDAQAAAHAIETYQQQQPSSQVELHRHFHGDVYGPRDAAPRKSPLLHGGDRPVRPGRTRARAFTRADPTLPSERTTTSISTSPVLFARRASSEYAAFTSRRRRGGSTPLPGR
jgi:hypothetical protein